MEPEHTMPLSAMDSRARSADEDCENLQKTTPLDAMRSVLQYCSSGQCAISSYVQYRGVSRQKVTSQPQYLALQIPCTKASDACMFGKFCCCTLLAPV